MGPFVIVSEEAIAKGIRRIQAITGVDADRARHRLAALAAKTAGVRAALSLC